MSASTSMCSILFIMSMTYERFYSIIRPHKAASFNTVKRAKITIVSIVLFSHLYHIPHIYLTINHGKRCIAYGKPVPYVPVFYWFSFVLKFIIPFISLLVMNTVIIHTLTKRSHSNFTRTGTHGHGEGRCQGQGQTSKMKTSERQIYIMLLVVTFAFLILITPGN